MLKIVSIFCFASLISACGGGSSSNDATSNVDAPDSMAGESIRHVIQAGSGLYATTGIFVAAISATDNTYVATGDNVNVGDSAGTYTYSRNGSVGDVTYVDSIISTGAECEYNFSTVNSGSFSCTAAEINSSQNGTFTLL